MTAGLLALALSVLALLTRSAAAVDPDTHAEFKAFVAGSDAYAEHYTFGVGDAFSTSLMLSSQIKYTLSNHSADTSSLIRFSAMSNERTMCRLKGYLQYCNHPFGNDDSTRLDVQEPFHIDFVVTDEPLRDPALPDLKNFPIFVFGITPAFHLPGISRLVLTKTVIARIFRGCDPLLDSACLPGSITSWGHPDIKASNPESIHALLDAAGPIKVVVDTSSGFLTDAFKRACSSFEAEFGIQMNNTRGTANWTGTHHIRAPGMHAMLKQCAQTPGCITYAKANMAHEQRTVEPITIQNAGYSQGKNSLIQADTKTLYAAFSEIGLDFGNDGSDPADLQIDLTGALGEKSWPIASLAYISFRKNDVDEFCVQRRTALLSFIEYIYTHQGRESTLFTEGFASITDEAAKVVLDLIRHNLDCDGEQVYVDPPPKPRVIIHAEVSMHQTLMKAAAVISDASVEIAPLHSHLAVKSQFQCDANVTCFDERYENDNLRSGMVVLADENLSSYIVRDDELDGKYKLLSMPFSALATGFIHNFCPVETNDNHACSYVYEKPLVLSLEVSAMILDLRITWWNDTRIQELNPEKALPREPIKVVSGPKSSTFHFDFITLVRRAYIPDFSFAGGGAGTGTYLEAWVDVSLTPFSISYVPFNGTLIENVERVALLSREGEVVLPDPRNIEACARDTFDKNSGVFFLSSSAEPDCWPLVQTFNIFVLQQVHHAAPAKVTKFLFSETVRTLAKDGELLERKANDTNDVVAAVTLLNVVGLGTLVDAVDNSGLNLAKHNFLALESITHASTGERVVRVPHELNLIPQSLIIVIYSLFTIELMIFLALGAWVFIHRNRKLIRNSSPVFMYQVLFGAILMSATVIPLSQQDSHLVPRGMTVQTLERSNAELDASCVTQPVLFSLGFFLTFSALFLKSWRLIKIFNNKKLRNLFLKDRQLLFYQSIVILLVIILNLVWALQSPLVWRRFVVFTDTSSDLVVASIGLCHSRTGVYPALPLTIGVILVLIVGNYLAYLGRRIPTEFNESKWTAMAMAFTLEAFVIGLPVLVLANGQPVPGYIIKTFCCLLVPGATVGLIFGPKVAMAYGIGVIEGESNPWRFVKKGDSGSNSGKETPSKSQNSKIPIAPSLNSMVESRMGVHPSDPRLGGQQQGSGQSPQIFSSETLKLFHRANAKKAMAGGPPDSGNKRASKNLGFNSPSEALSRVLQDDPMRRRFRRYLQTLKMEENVRFWDSIQMFRTEPDAHKRFVSARAIVQTFVLDSSPLQVNLSSSCQKQLVDAHNNLDKALMSSIDFFSPAANELFEDLRQSDAFRVFIENDTFSHQDIGNASKSDPMILVADTAIGGSTSTAPSNNTQVAPAMPL